MTKLEKMIRALVNEAIISTREECAKKVEKIPTYQFSKKFVAETIRKQDNEN